MTGDQSIDYETLQSDAMRGVVRAVLAQTARSGLPGDHHFYISFDTTVPGVSLSKRLKEKYPAEMTIVLQHRFWDLAVTDERFEVKLTFDGIPERLVVPFAALKVFFDPSVRYGLQFEDAEMTLRQQSVASNGDLDDEAGQPKDRSGTARKPRPARKVKGSGRESTDASEAAPNAPRAVQPGPATSRSGQPAKPAPSAEAPRNAANTAPAGGAQILSLDQFRKK